MKYTEDDIQVGDVIGMYSTKIGHSPFSTKVYFDIVDISDHCRTINNIDEVNTRVELRHQVNETRASYIYMDTLLKRLNLVNSDYALIKVLNPLYEIY